jgi:hypothetical protein
MGDRVTTGATSLLEPSEPSALVAELGRSGAADPEIAADCARSRGLLLFHGRPILLAVQQDPVIATTDVFVGVVDASVLAARDQLAALLAELVARYPEADRLFVRSPAGATVDGPPWLRLLMRYLARAAGPVEPDDEAGIRLADDSTTHFVQQLLAKTLRIGYAAAGYPISFETAVGYVRRTYPRFGPDATACALVTFDGDDPVGHVTWAPETYDDVTAAPYWELLDIETLDKGGGHGARLLAALERRAAGGAVLLGNVVVEPGSERWRGLYESLRRSGWSPTFDIWMCPRDAVPSAEPFA